MCTVSFVPVKDGCVFTFNRDEQPQRQTPEYIVHQMLNGKNIYYAKDVKAGGSWFAVDSKGNIAMLFNGAFAKHTKRTLYKKSRGLFLLELIATAEMLLCFKQLDLSGIEPFSILLFENKTLYRLTWDGFTKHITPLEMDRPHIFSSATLYEENMQQQRKIWLNNFLGEQENVNEETMYNFHSTYNTADKQNGLLIYREGSCSTLSISQAIFKNKKLQVKHYDIKTCNLYQKSLLIN